MSPPRRLPMIDDLRGKKGQRQLTMLRSFSLDEAAAAEAVGIDIASVPPEIVRHSHYRQVAPSIFSMTGMTHLEAGTPEDYLRWSGGAINRGADAVYCSGSLKTVEYLAREYIPVVGHVGLVPARATWTGGLRAVGKTAEAALRLYDEVRGYEAAGAFAVEIEVVPAEVATEIAKRVGILLWSMGAGAGCDAQYLFANDILSYTHIHVPRHSKTYRDFAKQYARLQDERVAAFLEFATEVAQRSYPEERYILHMVPAELDGFLTGLERRHDWPIRLADTTGRYDWPIRLADTTGRYDWPTRLADTTGRYDWPIRLGRSPELEFNLPGILRGRQRGRRTKC